MNWVVIACALAVIFSGLALIVARARYSRARYRPTMSRERQEAVWERQGLEVKPDDAKLL